MSDTVSPTGMSPRSSRRAFLKVVAAGSAAALTAPAFSLAAESKAAKKAAEKTGPTAPGRAPEIGRGLEEQRGYLKQTLEALRSHTLATNADQAFTFTPMKASRAERDR